MYFLKQKYDDQLQADGSENYISFVWMANSSGCWKTYSQTMFM